MVQDILIAPGSGEPYIEFYATGVPSPITLNVVSGVIPASGTSELSFEGTQGQLFSVSDNLSSGTIFSVSDVTGLPLIEADASGDVKIGEFGRNVGVGSGILPAYQLDVFGTGNFHQGVRFSDGTTQTTGATTVDTYSSGVGAYASGQAIENETLVTYASGLAIENETDLVYVSGAAAYASGNTIVNDGLIAYASGNTANIAFASNAEGDILYHNGTSFIRLAKGTDDYVLKMNGNVPNWESAGGGAGTMTSVKSNGSAVGGADIVTLDFSSRFSVTEDPDTEINIELATVPVAQGGTNATSLADKAVLITQDSGTDTVAAAVIDANGELLIGGTSGPAVATLTQGSNMTITNGDGTITLASAGASPPSDNRLKENIEPLNIKDFTEKLMQLQAVEFDWKEAAKEMFDREGRDFGYVAQDVDKIMPELVGEFNGYKNLDYGKIVVLLLEMTKELKQEVEELKQKLEST
jgi:hypothetical protein